VDLKSRLRVQRPGEQRTDRARWSATPGDALTGAAGAPGVHSVSIANVLASAELREWRRAREERGDQVDSASLLVDDARRPAVTTSAAEATLWNS
jgi:hypothetical protein